MVASGLNALTKCGYNKSRKGESGKEMARLLE